MTLSRWKLVRRHLTMILAVLFTVLLAVFVFAGKLEASRAIVAFIICWIMASHSFDISDHRDDMMRAVQELERAGIDYRTGRPVQCMDDLTQAGKIAQELWRQEQAKAHTGEPV